MKRFIICSMFFFMLVGAYAEGAKEKKMEKPSEIKFGFGTSSTGTFAAVAQDQNRGAEYATEEINTSGGISMPWGKVKLNTLFRDDETKVDVAVRRFRELTEEGIVGFSGAVYNPIAGALNEENKIANIVYLPGCVPALDSFRKGNPSDATYSLVFSPWTIGYVTVKIAAEKLNAKTIYYVNRSDSWGRTIRDGMVEAMKKYDVKLIGEREFSTGTVDWSAAINEANSLSPDVFASCFYGGDSVSLMKQAHDAGVQKRSVLFNIWTSTVIGVALPNEVLKDIQGLTFFYHNFEGYKDKKVAEASKKFVEGFQKKFNQPPDSYAAIAYMAFDLYRTASEKAGSFESGAIAKAIGTNSFNTIKGKGYFRGSHEFIGDNMVFYVKGKDASDMKDKYDVFKIIDSFGGEELVPSMKYLGY